MYQLVNLLCLLVLTCLTNRSYAVKTIDCNDGGFYIRADPENCSNFYKCDNGNPVLFTCDEGLYYNPAIYVCDWKRNVKCDLEQHGNNGITYSVAEQSNNDPTQQSNSGNNDLQQTNSGNNDLQQSNSGNNDLQQSNDYTNNAAENLEYNNQSQEDQNGDSPDYHW